MRPLVTKAFVMTKPCGEPCGPTTKKRSSVGGVYSYQSKFNVVIGIMTSP